MIVLSRWGCNAPVELITFLAPPQIVLIAPCCPLAFQKDADYNFSYLNQPLIAPHLIWVHRYLVDFQRPGSMAAAVLQMPCFSSIMNQRWKQVPSCISAQKSPPSHTFAINWELLFLWDHACCWVDLKIDLRLVFPPPVSRDLTLSHLVPHSAHSSFSRPTSRAGLGSLKFVGSTSILCWQAELVTQARFLPVWNSLQIQVHLTDSGHRAVFHPWASALNSSWMADSSCHPVKAGAYLASPVAVSDLRVSG